MKGRKTPCGMKIKKKRTIKPGEQRKKPQSKEKGGSYGKGSLSFGGEKDVSS